MTRQQVNNLIILALICGFCTWVAAQPPLPAYYRKPEPSEKAMDRYAKQMDRAREAIADGDLPDIPASPEVRMERVYYQRKALYPYDLSPPTQQQFGLAITVLMFVVTLAIILVPVWAVYRVIKYFVDKAVKLIATQYEIDRARRDKKVDE